MSCWPLTALQSWTVTPSSPEQRTSSPISSSTEPLELTGRPAYNFASNARRTVMMVARWSISAKFGYKQNVVDSMKRWLRDIGPQVGIKEEGSRLLTGSVGALEATVQTEHQIEDLAELNRVWDKL